MSSEISVSAQQYRGSVPVVSHRENATVQTGRNLRGFQIPEGDCAGIAHHDSWEDEATGAVSSSQAPIELLF